MTNNNTKYEETPISKTLTGKPYKKMVKLHMNRLTTLDIIVYLVFRHKVALLIFTNIVTLYAFGQYFYLRGF